MTIVYVFALIFFLFYAYLIYRFIQGWENLPTVLNYTKANTIVTVIIPFRNEEKNIIPLIKSLKKQNYPTDMWNVLFVNDHSTDQSCNLVLSELTDFTNAKLIHLSSAYSGKKSALEYGALKTNADLLLFTDADCTAVYTWISAIVSIYQTSHPFLISAPVGMEPGISFFSKFQTIEFLGLIGSGAASFGINNPILVNGANLAVKREIYIEYLSKKQIRTPSGDDIFLLLNLKKKYPDKLIFLKSGDACIKTSCMSDIKSFLIQRFRWTSKARYYKDTSIILIALLIFLTNLSLLILFVSGFFNFRFLILWIMVFILKSIADYIFLKKVITFFDQKALLKYFVLSQFVYFIYIGFTGILGNIIALRWKDRKIQP